MDDPATEPSQLLASDAEREHSVLVLRDAVAEGRLTLEEFGERVGGAQTARTHGELARLTADLPQRPLPVPAAAAAPVRYSAVCSHIARSGAWQLPSRSRWRAICGTVDIDLREVRLTDSEVELEVFNLFGTVTVLVPAGIAVEVDGGGLFASQIIDPPPFPAPGGAPRVRIRASGPGGTLRVRSVGPRE